MVTRIEGTPIQLPTTRLPTSALGFQVNQGEGAIRPLGNGIVEAEGQLRNGEQAKIVFNNETNQFTIFAGNEPGRPASNLELQYLQQHFATSNVPDAQGFAQLIEMTRAVPGAASGQPPIGINGGGGGYPLPGDGFNPGGLPPGPTSPYPQQLPGMDAQMMERQQFGQACAVLATHFQQAGGGFFSGGTIDMNELYAAAQGRKGPEVQQAAAFLVSHPQYVQELETRGKASPDGKISLKDLSLEIGQLGRESQLNQLRYDGRLPAFQQSLATLTAYMPAVDKAGSFFSLRDGKFSMKDLNAVAGGNYPPDVRQAALFLATNPDLFRLADTGAYGGTMHSGARPDGVVSMNDLQVLQGQLANMRSGMPTTGINPGGWQNPGFFPSQGGVSGVGGWQNPGFAGGGYVPGMVPGMGLPGFNPFNQGVNVQTPDGQIHNTQKEKTHAKVRGFLGVLKMIPGVGNAINAVETLVGVPKTIGTWLNPTKSLGDKLKATADLGVHALGILPGWNMVSGGYDIAQGIGRNMKWNAIEQQQLGAQLGGLPPYQFNGGGYPMQYPGLMQQGYGDMGMGVPGVGMGVPGLGMPGLGVPGMGFNPFNQGVNVQTADGQIHNTHTEKTHAKARGFLGLLKMIPGVGNAINAVETLVGVPKTIGTWLNPTKSFGDKLKATADLGIHALGILPGWNMVSGGYDIAQGIGRNMKWNAIEQQQLGAQLGNGLPPFQFNPGAYPMQYQPQYAMA